VVGQGKGGQPPADRPLVPSTQNGCQSRCELACAKRENGLLVSPSVWFWHPSGMQTALSRVPGGRFPCGPETTTGYLLTTLRVGLTIGKEWVDLPQARAGTR
jgi:hypothetical protein